MYLSCIKLQSNNLIRYEPRDFKTKPRATALQKQKEVRQQIDLLLTSFYFYAARRSRLSSISRRSKVRLFNCNFSACFFKLFFDSFCFCFANTFFKDLWSRCNKVFSFFKTKSCKFTYSFDYWYTRTFC